jgi:RnfABCDGE-type electron transport complex B subunit
MYIVTVGLAAGTMVCMAIILTSVLGWANKAFHVEVDNRVQEINENLPGANCGGCGYVGCGEYAEAVVESGAPVNMCTVGGDSCAAVIAEIMGVEVGDSFKIMPVVHCGAKDEERLGKNEYIGEHECRAANLVAGVQGCIYGCLGFGDCTRECNFDALDVVDGLAVVDYEKCVGCGACVKACPRNIITMNSFEYNHLLAVLCSNHDTGKQSKKACQVGCVGCKVCTKVSDLFTVEDNLSIINYEKYSDDRLEELSKAAKKCPRHCLGFIFGISKRKNEA